MVFQGFVLNRRTSADPFGGDTYYAVTQLTPYLWTTEFLGSSLRHV